VEVVVKKRGNMQISIIIFCILGGYLLGSISIPRLVTRIVAPGQDLEHIELKNYSEGGTFQLKTVGATTASLILGPKIGGLIGFLDILKGAIPTLLVRLLFPDHPYFLFIGAAIVVGHIWPIYHAFRGGGGLSPALGTFLVVDPLGILISVFLAFLIGMFILKEIKVTVLGGPILFILWLAISSGNGLFIIFSVFINLIMIIAVIPDVRVNLKARQEGKMDSSSAMEEIPMGKMMKKLMDKMSKFTLKKN
jgi:glycerol-3-phosphate acyltransferase PlsY